MTRSKTELHLQLNPAIPRLTLARDQELGLENETVSNGFVAGGQKETVRNWSGEPLVSLITGLKSLCENSAIQKGWLKPRQFAGSEG